MILEDLIIRFRLANYQIFLVGFLYGLFPTAFLTGNLFNQRIYWGITVAGINLGTLFVIGILAWGVMQGIISLYFANRLEKRDWSHPQMGIIGWIVVILFQLIIIAIAQLNPITPRGPIMSYIIVVLLIIICVGLFIKTIKISRPQPQPFQPSKVLDFVAFGSVILFLILGTFFISGDIIVTSQPLNQLATIIENIWVFFCGGIFFLYRFWKKSDVTV
jgi:hypothetical protein